MIRRVSLLVLAFGALAAPAALAASHVISVPRVFRAVLPKVRARSHLPVLLPARADLGVPASQVHATGGARRGSYDLELAAAPNCGGANACFLGSFTAVRARRLGDTVNVRLAHGLGGHFHDLSCGASCSPPSISWLERGVRYRMQVNASGNGSLRSQLAALANSAIRAGPR